MRILYNARIYTLDTQKPIASAIAIDNGRVVAVGDTDSLFSAINKPYERIDLAQKIVLPGLVDAHIHLEKYAFSIQKVDCETSTRAECLSRMAVRARDAAPGEWILGHGWNQNDWPEGFGSQIDLDRISAQHPVYLTAKSLHAAWVNSLALQIGGVTSSTPDPPGGIIGRYENGEPNGLLFESAMQSVADTIPKPSAVEAAQAIKEALPRLWSLGLTGAHDFDQQLCFQALQQLNQDQQLLFRVSKSILLEDIHHAVALGLQTGFGDDFLRIGCVKAFADGALGPRTAAMLQPYAGEPDNRGLLLLDGEELYEYGKLAVENGLALAVHAIGDRANHEVINAFAQIRKLEGSLLANKRITAPKRHRIEHVQLIHPEDAPMLAKLGIIASMQPIHATSDMLMADTYWQARAAHSYAWQTQLIHGAHLAFGSDAPVESPNPFWGLHAAITRRRADGSPGPDGWYPEQRIDIHQAIQVYTTGAAYAAGLEQSQGKLMPGFFADMIVLDTDPYRCEPERLRDIRPSATMVAGKWVYNA